MRKKTYKLGAVVLLVAGFGVAAVNADSITTYPKVDYPATAEIITVPSADADFGDDANVSLAQTFSVDAAFSLQTIYIPYENDANGIAAWSMKIRIFPVADVSAVTLVASGADVYTGTFTFTAPPDDLTQYMAQIELTNAVPLAASEGTSGYAMEITEASGGDFNPGWEWLRPTSESYAGGVMYEDGAIKNSGERDLSLALAGAPVPTANDDEYILLPGSTSTNVAAPGVLANDFLYDSAVLVTDISSGFLTFNSDGSFECSGLSDGSNTFSYAVVGGSVTSAPATVLLTVILVEDPPDAVDNTFSMDLTYGDHIEGNVLNNDTNNSLVFAMFAMETSSVSNGILTLSADGEFYYTPDSGFSGTDSFSYKAYTEASTSTVATVTLTIAAKDTSLGTLIDGFENYVNSNAVDVVDIPAALANWDPYDSGLVEIQDRGGNGPNYQLMRFGYNTGYRGAVSTDALFSGIPQSSTEYWLYAEMNLTDSNANMDGNFGVTTNLAPVVGTNDRGDFSAGVRFSADGAGTLNLYAFTGGTNDLLLTNGVAVDAWHGIWLNINNEANTYDVYLGAVGDPGSPGTQVGSDIAFDAGSADLARLLVSSYRTSYIDNIMNVNMGTPYESWASDQGLTSGVNAAYGDDPDADDMDNLLEYALGSDPMLQDATAFLPGYEVSADGSSNYLNYIYRRRIDYVDLGMTYEVGAGGNLVYEPLTNATEYVDAGVIDADFESVTNRISTDVESAQFMQLKVTID
jgi:hypothetical protein